MHEGEILSEIDATLGQLIQNAYTLKTANMNELTEIEINAFQKTQESLLHHLIHMDQLFEKKRKRSPTLNTKTVSYKIQEKSLVFEQLQTEVEQSLSRVTKKNFIVNKRRKKRLLQCNYNGYA